ncbi:phospholipid-transporting ATPase ABCA1-like isoform X2 [Haliotis rufescens]|uniref:phospholipid-transporting ATPase ABCA1-like isoform X2 n=1 Tax=Haliotis rufescens TaxID=6454 RepID=UPI00201F9859|nr:phospholipid-transporting ATPase ABCA1-like isoform X2 [Haliotis rufescens]
MGFGNQLLLLLWKNFTLRKRQPLRVVIELVWPLCLFLILVGVRTRPDLIINNPECHFDGKAMPSAGTLPFLQSFLCTFNNTCHQSVTADERAGTVDSFNSSTISKLLEDIEKVLANNTEREEIFDLINDLENLQQLQDIVWNGTSVGSLRLGNLLVDPEQLRQQIAAQNINLTEGALNSLLNASLSIRNLVSNVTSGEISPLMNLGVFLKELELPDNASNFNSNLDQLRTNVCNNSLLERYFQFGSPADARNVQDQLCNLNITEAVELYRDFRDDINVNQVVNEVSEYVFQNTGVRPNFDMASYTRLLRLFRDVNDLSSLQALQKDLIDLRDEMQDAQQASGPRNVTRDLSRLICGRPNAFLQINPSNKNLFSGESGSGRVDMKESEEEKKKREKEREDELKEFSPFCIDLFASFESTRYTRIIWRQLKPVILGFIPYAPDNAATRAIIKQANATFENLASLLDLADDWLDDVSPRLYNYLDNSTSINALRRLTSKSGCANLSNSLTQLRELSPSSNIPTFNTSTCDYFARYLYNGPNTTEYDWRDSINYTNYFMAEVKKYLQCFRFDKFRPYASEYSLIQDSLDMIPTNTFWAALVFETEADAASVPNHMTYKIRMDTDKIDSTKKVQDKYWKPGPRAQVGIDTKYLTYGFAFLQDMVDHALIRVQTGVEEEVGVYMQQFPYPCYVKNRFTMTISRTMPMFMVLAWIYSVAMIVKGIVYEKERRLKEVMKMMGLGNGVHWLAWFINAFVMMIITVVMLVALLKGGKVFEHSDPSVIFVFMLAFTIATIMQCFLISVFFSRANLAAVCGGFLYFLLYMPYTQVVQWEEFISTSIKLVSCLSSSVAFGFGCSYISRFEEQTTGLQWSNIADSPIPDDDFNMARCILMMFADALMYGIITWYIEAVFPGQYGIPRKWYFPIQKTYWCGQRYRGDTNVAGNLGAADMEMNCDKENLEAESPNSKVGVSIHNMTKVYKTGKKLAVDGLSLNFYEGQITSFLGHNGAGKTTTMSILTGLFPPTSGTAYINGKDIRSQMDDIRSSLGMCPQHNVLFDLLTVEEHIWFYARLKGRTNAEVKRELPQMVKDVGLPNKIKEISKNLSGGMKRKLSVAIAFVGGSRTVILDEPTAGVDPYARRAIWDLLVKLRTNRTIIMSTHHMDEADILGDRIAIISHGRLCCCGSSLFLKNRFGSGYYLTLVRQQDQDQDQNEVPVKDVIKPKPSRPSTAGSIRSTIDVVPSFEMDDEGYSERPDSDKTSSSNSSNPPTPPPEGATMIPGFSVQRVTAFIQKFVSGAKLTEDNNTELCYQLPEEAAHSGDFEALFCQLERSHFDLGISSFGISDTSLEEVFLKVAEESGVDCPTDEMTRKQLEQVYDGGKYPRPVSRLSFRKKKFGIFPTKQGVNRVNSTTDLMEDSDLEMTAHTQRMKNETSETASDPGFCAESETKLSGWNLKRRQFWALFLKRFHHVRRSKKGFVCEIILPAGFVCLAMVFALILPPFQEEPALELHPWLYVPQKGDAHLYMFYSNDDPGTTLADKLENTLLSKPYLGTRCMNSSVYHISGMPCEPSSATGKWTARPKLTGNLSIDSPSCSCATGIQKCPPGAGGPIPPRSYLPTTDYLYNMTGRNTSDWLVKTMDQYIKRRYGGFSFGDKNPVAQLNATQLLTVIDRLSRAGNNGSAVVDGNETVWQDLDDLIKRFVRQDIAKVWFNNKGWAASVAYMNSLNNIILRSYLPSSKDPSNFGITTINHPLNYTQDQLNEETIMNSAIDVLVAICVIFAMSFIPASFVLVLIEERVSNSKHLQFVSGINPTIYWVANFTWDMMNYLIPALLCFIIFLAFNKEAYVGPGHAPCLVALLFLYGFAIIPLMYPFARLFSVPSSAFVALSCVNVFLGTVSTLATFILEVFEQDDKGLADINNILKQAFLIMPHYCLGRGLMDMTAYKLQADIITRFGETLDYNLFDWKIVGRNLFAMFALGIVFFIFNLLIEYRFFIKPRKTKGPSTPLNNEDIDVARERQRVMSGGADNDTLKLENLTKTYWTPGKKGRLTAVDRLCVGVPKGQCFGLLGVNGAGKTTTFKMLTGDVSVTSGSAAVSDMSILKDMVKVRQLMGYCPQFDALDSLLTGREHLQFYARVRGIPEKDIKDVAEWAIRKLGLVKYANVIAGSYSGGNKRKLSTAIALIGNPPIIFLDEPTTGMDPKARRFLWNCINSIIKDGRSIILTSHSMEECEALCGRLAIMVNGRFKCIGSTQHLKNRFGNGYTVTLRVAGGQPDLEPVKQYMKEQFPESVLKESHHNMLQYQLGTTAISLARLFGKIEGGKQHMGIESYSVSQTTLDQVFINFAKLQTDMDIELEDDELPPDLSQRAYETAMYPNQQRMMIEDEQSVTGSTAGLILPNRARDNFLTDVSVA